MWFRRGLSYRLVLVLIFPVAYCQLIPVSFTVTDISTLVTITSDFFTLQDPSTSFMTDGFGVSPETNLAAPSTVPTSSAIITASLTSSPTITASTSPEPVPSSTPGSSDSSPAAAIGGSVGGALAAIIIAFVILSRRKGWFIGKTKDPELGERDGEEDTGVRHELEGDPGKYPALAEAELPGSVPAFELPEGGHDEGSEGVGEIEH